MIDTSSEFGARAAAHLRDEQVVWLTTVTKAGAPLPRPVWFLWDGAETVLVYSMPGARVANLARNPNVTLNFSGDGKGGDIVVIRGTAALDESVPPADENPDYLAKYADGITRIGTTASGFATRYSVPVRVTFARVDGH
jgi:PPOX class probable F420-dependent enzyme